MAQGFAWYTEEEARSHVFANVVTTVAIANSFGRKERYLSSTFASAISNNYSGYVLSERRETFQILQHSNSNS